MDSDTQKILTALDISLLPEDEQEEFLLDLNDVVFQGTMVRLIEQMDTKVQEKFSQLVERDAPEEELEAFIQTHVSNPDKAVQDTLAELKNDILAVTK